MCINDTSLCCIFKKNVFGDTLKHRTISRLGLNHVHVIFHLSLTVKLYPRQLNILTNWTTGFDVYSVLIPKDSVGSLVALKH